MAVERLNRTRGKGERKEGGRPSAAGRYLRRSLRVFHVNAAVDFMMKPLVKDFSAKWLTDDAEFKDPFAKFPGTVLC